MRVALRASSIRFAAGLYFAFACTFALAQQSVLEVITLNYRNADEMIPILQPMLSPQGSLSAMGSRLIVRTTRANLEELKQILATLDARPRRLLISVRQDADLSSARSGAEISGTVGIGDHARVTIPGSRTRPGSAVVQGGAGATSVQAQVYERDSQARERVSQTVQVMEGNPAFIRAGQSVPVRQQQVIQTPTGRQVVESTSFQGVDTGFYVVARLSGDRVTLEISAANDRMHDVRRDTPRHPGRIAVQRVHTSVSGRLGEWIEIGAVDQQADRGDEAMLGRSRESRNDQRRVALMVEELH